MIYLTSDMHFYHKRMLQFRPFDTVEEMNEALISNWNKVVKPTDEVWHLGDFSFGNQDRTRDIFNRLNGRINIVFGNHDQVLKKAKFNLSQYVESYQDYKELKVNNQLYVLMHYPLLTWNKGHYGSYMLHGHSHSGLDELNKTTTRLDVGIDCEYSNYAPISLEEINFIMSKKIYFPVDHHK